MTSAPASPAVVTVPSVDLGTLIGARGPTIAWDRVALFAAASIAARLVWGIWALVGPSPAPGAAFSAGIVINAILFTGSLVLALRKIANPYAAIAVATVAFVVLVQGERLLLGAYPADMPDFWRFLGQVSLPVAVNTYVSTALLALALQLMQPLWIALVAGSVGGQLAASVVSALTAAVVSPGGGFRVGFNAAELGVGVLDSLALAGVILVGLQLGWVALPRPGTGVAYAEGAGIRRMSKGVYVGVPATCFAISIALILAANSLARSGSAAGVSPLPLALLLLAVGGIIFAVFVYKIWAAIQDGHARTTPGRAVGLLFVPLFNIYWAFQVLPGFAVDYNKLLARRGLGLRPLPPGLFATYVGLSFGAVIPTLGLVLIVVNYFVALAMLSRACDAVNALPAA